MNAIAGVPRRLTSDGSQDTWASWSADGRWVYYLKFGDRSADIWKVPAAGGLSEQVTRDRGLKAWESSDGRFLYYSNDQPAIWRMPAEGWELKAGPELPQRDRVGRRVGAVGHRNLLAEHPGLAAAGNRVLQFRDGRCHQGGDATWKLRLRQRILGFTRRSMAGLRSARLRWLRSDDDRWSAVVRGGAGSPARLVHGRPRSGGAGPDATSRSIVNVASVLGALSRNSSCARRGQARSLPGPAIDRLRSVRTSSRRSGGSDGHLPAPKLDSLRQVSG